MDLQRHDPVAMQLEDMIEVYRTAREIARDLGSNDCLAVSLGDAERLDGVVVLLAGLAPPRLDCGDTLDRPPFVSHDRIRKRSSDPDSRCRGRLRCEVDGDRFCEMNGHRSLPSPKSWRLSKF